LMKHAEQPVAEVISGHSVDGAATSKPHLAIVPLANVGWPYSTGELLGFAVILPREIGDERRQVLKALSGFCHAGESEPSYGELRLPNTILWRLERTVVPSRASLKSERWCAVADTWASATPLLLDRFPDHGDPIEEARLIAAACVNIGLPEPGKIEIHKHS